MLRSPLFQADLTALLVMEREWDGLCASIAKYYVLNRLFGFLAGSTLAGAGVYYYILEEYKVSNELLTEDIYVRLCI